MEVNPYFSKLRSSYLFTEVAKRERDYCKAHPEKRVIKLGIGDVVLPLVPAIVERMHKAVDELSKAETFRGYGPEIGYRSLRSLVAERDYQARGIAVDVEEVFISDGAGSDIGNMVDLFGSKCKIAVADPVYPAYIDSNVMGGHAGEWSGEKWGEIIYLPCTAENGFMPQLPEERPDVIYLCSPNNPTGIAMSRQQLQKFVDYARKEECLIIYDGAYEAFIRNAEIPRSIYELEGAEECAIEIRSYSKTAGLTGVRCGYTVVPKGLKVGTINGEPCDLNHYWNRRQCTKFNGASYISQCAAEAVYSEEGARQVRSNIDYYMGNATLLRESLAGKGIEAFGGTDGPYVWMKTPSVMKSWEFFDVLLQQQQIVCTPGVGFGPSGEGYCRLSSFAKREEVEEAVERISKLNV